MRLSEGRRNPMTFHEADGGCGHYPLHVPWSTEYRKYKYRLLHDQPIEERLDEAKSGDFVDRITERTRTLVEDIIFKEPTEDPPEKEPYYEADDFSPPKTGRMISPRRWRKKQRRESTAQQGVQEDFKVISREDLFKYVDFVENRYLRDLLKGQGDCFEVLRNSQGFHRVKIVMEPKLNERKIEEIMQEWDQIQRHCSNLRMYREGTCWWAVDENDIRKWEKSERLAEMREILFYRKNLMGGAKLLCERAAKGLHAAFNDRSKKLKRSQSAVLQSGLDILSSGRGLSEQEQEYWESIYQKDDLMWKNPHALMRHINVRLKEIKYKRKIMPEGVNLRRLHKLLNWEPSEVDVATKAICSACLMAIYTGSGGSYQRGDKFRKKQRHYRERSREEAMEKNFR